MSKTELKNNIKYHLIENIPNKNILDLLLNCYTSIFEDAVQEFFIQRIHEKENILSVLAFHNKQLVGFKIGYRYNSNTFYSWIGGVLPKYRANGIAAQLANLQEYWVKNNGYKKLRTKSMNRYKPMLILNIKNDFDIIQVYTNDSGQTKIVFEKVF